MNYQEAVKQSLEYLHRHHGEPIRVADVAEQVYLSPSYFSTVFRVMTGYSVKDYLNQYRLYRAAADLRDTAVPVMDIALDRGFSSQQALSKGFVQKYGIPPARFRRLRPVLLPFPPANRWREREGTMQSIKEVFSNVRYEKKDSFFVAGLETDINYNEPDHQGTAPIGGLFDRWYGEALGERIPDQVNKGMVYGMTHESTEEDTAKYMVGVEVTTLSNIPVGFVGRRFYGCEFAVFDTTLEMETSGEFWRYFYGTWLGETGYSQPETVHTKKKHSFTRNPNYEVYPPDFQNESSRILIYAPVLR